MADERKGQLEKLKDQLKERDQHISQLNGKVNEIKESESSYKGIFNAHSIYSP